jgi:hypothetical protein
MLVVMFVMAVTLLRAPRRKLPCGLEKAKFWPMRVLLKLGCMSKLDLWKSLRIFVVKTAREYSFSLLNRNCFLL